MTCCICGAEAQDVERADVRSNVRKFASERFGVWRCSACRSIHASDEADLAHYYADYPFHKLGESEVDWMLQAMYRNLLQRLRSSGLAEGSRVLDYGCGGGRFLSYLKRAGFADAAGYDEFSPPYDDRTVLARTYDCVVTQDVIEHVADPLTFARELDGLTRPGGFIAIGTPDADSVNLERPEDGIHSLHQPYHRHILSKAALCQVGEALGWKLVQFYPTMYSNTLVPFVNGAFLAHYFRIFDNNVDLAIEPIHLGNWRVWTPYTLATAFFGYFFPPKSDMMAVFQRPSAGDAAS